MLNQFLNIDNRMNKLIIPIHNPCREVIFKIFLRTTVTMYLSSHSVETLQESKREELY